MVNLTIDGRAIQAKKGQTILEVARDNGIYIPYLCYHKALKPIASCRICVVEVKPGPPRPQPACSTYVTEGMEVVTTSERLDVIRRELVKLVLINHALDCPICDKGGECELQNLTHALGIDRVDYEAQVLTPHIDYESSLIERHPDRCVTCGRCIRICRDRVGAMAIHFMNRGYYTELGSGVLPLDCEFCGSCIEICPVGALINKVFKYQARAWELEKTETVCPFCGGGCTYQVQTRDGRILRVANQDSILLCGRGRFGFPVVHSEDRLTTPLIKENGSFRPASWGEALDLVAQRFQEIMAEAGPGAIYGVGSPRATNESNYLFQKFFREVLKTNNLDNPGRYHFVRGMAGLMAVFGVSQVDGLAAPAARVPAYHSPYEVTEGATGSGLMFVLGKLADLPQADVALVVGADVTTELPPLGWALMKARENENFQLIVANPRATKFDRYAALSLQYKPGAERLLMGGLFKAIFAAQPDIAPVINAAGLEEFKESFKKFSLKEYATKAGVDEGQLKTAAELLLKAQAPAIIFGTELLGQDKGQENATALADLFLLVGKPGNPGSGVYMAAEKANTLGLLVVGVLPDRLPGFIPIDKDPGLNLEQMLEALETGHDNAPQALYALGGDLVRWLPNRSRTEKLLKKLKFIVVQDAFLTDTAKLADVILPVAIHVEQEGTFFSSDSKLGLLRKALPENGVRPDWQIIMELANRLGGAFKYVKPAQIFQELAAQLPVCAGLAPGHCFPAPGLTAKLSGQFVPFEQDISLPGRRPYTLIVGKSLQHSGSYTTHQPCGTLMVTPGARLKMNPEDAVALNLGAGETAKIISSHGEITASVSLDADLPPGVVLLPDHFGEPAANRLTLNSNLVRVTIQKM